MNQGESLKGAIYQRDGEAPYTSFPLFSYSFLLPLLANDSCTSAQTRSLAQVHQHYHIQSLKGRLFGLLWILSFVAPMVTTYTILQIQKMQVNKEVKWKMIAKLDKKEFVLLKLSEEQQQTQLHWKEAKEFEYKGEMFDIVEAKVIGDTTYYWLWADEEDTQLNKQLNDLVFFALGNDPRNQEDHDRLYKYFKSLYFLASKTTKTIAFLETKHKYFFGNTIYQSLSDAPLTPPPKYC